jgi:hypothetical protein
MIQIRSNYQAYLSTLSRAELPKDRYQARQVSAHTNYGPYRRRCSQPSLTAWSKSLREGRRGVFCLLTALQFNNLTTPVAFRNLAGSIESLA